MQVYQCKTNTLPGSSYSEVCRQARRVYRLVEKRTRRQPYVRSRYFSKDKIFINAFWNHVKQKRYSDRVRRMRLYACAIELLRHTTCEPITKENPNKTNALLFRFGGMTPEGELFFVQVEESKRSGSKYFVSVFPGN